jgi:hypothetical protein
MTLTRVTPAGAPFWARTNGLATYGGDSAKENYAGVAALGGDTDLDADALNRLAADAVATARTTPFCVISYTTRESTAEDPLVTYVALPTGVYVGDPYDGGNPPTGFPTVEISGTDVPPRRTALVTLASSYLDPFGVAQSFSIVRARVSINDLTAGLMPKFMSVSSTTVATIVLNDSAAVQQDKSLTVEIW